MDAPKIEVDTNGWDRWQRYVVETLGDLKKGQDDLYSEVTEARIEIGKLQVKSGIWGFAAGLIPSIAAVLLLHK